MNHTPDPNPVADPASADGQPSDSQRELELALGDGAAPGLADREYRFYRSTIRWLGSVAIRLRPRRGRDGSLWTRYNSELARRRRYGRRRRDGGRIQVSANDHGSLR